jgi:hypothetical protein
MEVSGQFHSQAALSHNLPFYLIAYETVALNWRVLIYVMFFFQEFFYRVIRKVTV